MSGAAGIAAAKNRRSKPDPNQKPIVSCSSKSGNCPLPTNNTKTQSLQTRGASVLDENSMQITGPMPLVHVLKVHEQRLNKIDEKLSQTQSQMQAASRSAQPPVMQAAVMQPATIQAAGCDQECYERLSSLEEKIHMLEEVIMNLQLTLTNVQSFAMETSLAMMKLQKQIPAIVPATAPASPAVAPAPTPTSLVVAPAPVEVTPVVVESAPLVVESAPVVVESAPLVVESAPLVVESAPLVVESAPLAPAPLVVAPAANKKVTNNKKAEPVDRKVTLDIAEYTCG
jgi:uncharacterized coiled-coil protein SlyX